MGKKLKIRLGGFLPVNWWLQGETFLEGDPIMGLRPSGARLSSPHPPSTTIS